MICASRGRSAPLGRLLPLNKENIKKKGAGLGCCHAIQRNENIIYGTRKPGALADAECRVPYPAGEAERLRVSFHTNPPPRPKPVPQRHYLFAFSEVFRHRKRFQVKWATIRGLLATRLLAVPGIRHIQNMPWDAG